MSKKVTKKCVRFPINELTMIYFISVQNDLNLRDQRQSDQASIIFQNSINLN
jgi:hypothetical protein